METKKFKNTLHFPEPDYSRPTFQFSNEFKNKILKRMNFLYGKEITEMYMPELERYIKIYYAHKPDEMIEEESWIRDADRFTEEDIILITYGDIIRSENEPPIKTLATFCDKYLSGTINTLHILPFFPYSSDRGFSIIDFETVDPRLGTWQDIEDLEHRYQLMFDGVINHVSSKSRWFQEFLNGSPYYKDFFIAYKSPDDLSEDDRKKIFRPRTTDILTRYETIEGTRHVWATFSKDQIDLNYKNPNVLIRVLDILLMYVRHGADIIRLDAVTYLWSEPGTRCIHLDQTHEIVKLCRDILNEIAPWVAIITETNVPHEENISYFGNGYDEAQMVYNFALPPLVLHTFYREDATVISKWAETLILPSDKTTLFNFLDSHDGIGLMAVKNILSKDDINFVIEKAGEHNAFISYKTGENGKNEPYELNITWFSALNGTSNEETEDIAFQVKKFIASRAIALVLQGVPGIYLHSLIGTKNDIDSVLETDSKRDINRSVLNYQAIETAIKDPLSKISRINRQLGRILKIRTKQKAFHPNASQKILYFSPEIFSLLRISRDKEQKILSLINVSNKVKEIQIPLEEIDVYSMEWYDLISEMKWNVDNGMIYVSMQPYDIIWLATN